MFLVMLYILFVIDIYIYIPYMNMIILLYVSCIYIYSYAQAGCAARPGGLSITYDIYIYHKGIREY